MSFLKENNVDLTDVKVKYDFATYGVAPVNLMQISIHNKFTLILVIILC